MTSVNLKQWMQHPEMLNRETLYELRTYVARYPYFQSARLLYLKNLFLLHDITFGAELRNATLYVTDRRALFYLVEGDRYSLRMPRTNTVAVDVNEDEEPGLDRTLKLIDAFLSTVPEELTLQTSLDYSTDYTSYLLSPKSIDEAATEEGTSAPPQLRGQALIDGFILQTDEDSAHARIKIGQTSESVSVLETEVEQEEIEREESVNVLTHLEEDEDDSCFTETLAKIYIKQQRYSKALEIIKKISLKYPKKNGYFVDQIRFLEKLIINTKSK